jgi:hypothetical protein
LSYETLRRSPLKEDNLKETFNPIHTSTYIKKRKRVIVFAVFVTWQRFL